MALALGVLMGLGIYFDLAGPVGAGLAFVGDVLFGVASLAVPVVLVAVGFLLIRGPSGDVETRRARAVLGTVLVVLSITGLLHIARGAPPWGEGFDGFRDAGGVIGAGIAEPLQAAFAVPGTVVVLLVLGLLGVLVLTRATVRGAAASVRELLEPAAGGAKSWLGGLFRVGREQPGTETDDAEAGWSTPRLGVTLFDQDTDADAIEAAESPGAVDPVEVVDPPVEVDSVEPRQLEIDLFPAPVGSRWKLPPMSLLTRAGEADVDQGLLEQTGRTLEHALAEHGVETRLVGMVAGPTVTRYELELGPGVKVARVTSLHKDIAYAMASPDVRILAPIPGRQAIGVEVPNVRRQVVALGDILSSPEAAEANHPLEVAIGRDINGRAVLENLAATPHLLIAGATGAGKSSCINSIITSVLMRSTPDQVRLILIDPKRVELTQYNRLPHLLTQVVTDPKKAANALAWAVKEMERRYELLSAVGVRDISGFNRAVVDGDLTEWPEGFVPPGVSSDDGSPAITPLPFILVVVDELNDLMMVAARDVEDSICRLAQMARAVGIHLVIATQRPSVNVITGVIKANIPARMAFAVSSLADSRVILDQPGAERLVGKGDLLSLGSSSSTPRRIQGAWVDESEVRQVTAAWRRQAPEVHYDDTIEGEAVTVGGAGRSGGDDDDELLAEAMELVVRSQLGSTSMLQRKLRVGFARAGRLMDLLEQRGVVGPSEGSKARAVLMTPEEFGISADVEHSS